MSAAGEWVRMSERLPEVDRDVLVGRIRESRYGESVYTSLESDVRRIVMVPYITGNGGSGSTPRLYPGGCEPLNYTHWAEIIAPPKVQP
jgi:hypothetical protein